MRTAVSAICIAAWLVGAWSAADARADATKTPDARPVEAAYRVELLDVDATARTVPAATTPTLPKRLSLPYREQGSWMRITIERMPAAPRLVVESQAADEVTLVLPDGHRQVRNKLHPDDDIDASPVALVFPLPADLARGATLSLHVAHRHLALTSVRVLGDAQWQVQERRMLVLGAMLLAALMSFALASLCVWLVVREKMYLYYALFLVSWLGFSASNTGLLYAVPGSGVIAALGIHGQWAIVAASFAMAVGFAGGFLDVARHAPRLLPVFDTVRRVLLVVAVAIAVSPWQAAWFGMSMSAVVLTLYPAMVGVGAYVAWTTRDRYAIYFLVGWVPMMLGSMLRAVQAAGLVQVGSAVTYLYTVGVLLQAVVLMGGLADRLLRTRRERDLARHAAERDALTGTLSRRALDERLAAAVADAKAGGRGVALLFLDIDHFKSINDKHGHATGDYVLRELARRIAAELRARDALGRWGGEEFVALLPDAGIEDARQLSERVRRMVGDRPVEIGELTVTATISIGIAVFDPARDDASSLIARADAALYRAKAGGRNRVESAALAAA